MPDTREAYYVKGQPVSKAEYLADGGIDVPPRSRWPPMTYGDHVWIKWPGFSMYVCEKCKMLFNGDAPKQCPGKPPEEPMPPVLEGKLSVPLEPSGLSKHALSAFDENGKTVYLIDGSEVDRYTWLAHALTKGTWEEIQRIEKKNFGNVQNYLHNTLGLTRTFVEDMIRDRVDAQVKEAIDRRLDGIEKAGESWPSTNASWFTQLVHAQVKKEIDKVLKAPPLTSSSLSDFVEKVVRDQVQRHITSRMKLDIRVTSVNPEDGVLREVVTPETIREAREL